MSRSTPTEELRRSARQAAGTPNVREAVYVLALHALRSRPLTAEHIASVARAIGEGIESTDPALAVPAGVTRRRAWAGLEDAVNEALHAIELAVSEFAGDRAAPGGREEILAQIALMERSLEQGWDRGGGMPRALKSRITSLTTLLRQTMAGGNGAQSLSEEAIEADRVLSLLASGVLVGLSQAPRDSPQETCR